MRNRLARFRLIPTLIGVVLLVLGCASRPGRVQPPSATGALLFGSLELPAEVRDQIQWVIVYKLGEVYAPPFKSPIKARVFPNGDFYMENVAPGSYFVHDAVAAFEAFYLYPPDISDAKQVALANAVEVGPGSLAYLGRHRVHAWKPGLQSKLSPQAGSVRFLANPPVTGPAPLPNFMDKTSALAPGAGTFRLERTRPRGDERRVLQAILGEVRGTGWDARIEGRLAALR